VKYSHLERGMELKISLAMIVKNEENYIERCIQSVKDLVDEIVVVDTGSTDNTINILKKYKNIKIHHFEWCDDFSLARNFSIENTKGDYILVLDGDEYVSKGSRNDLELCMACNRIGRILINSRFKKDGQVFHSKLYVSRFFPREFRFVGAIHEQLDGNIPREKLNLIFKHDGYYETKKSQRNIPMLIKEINKNPRDEYYLFQLGRELRINKQFKEAFHFLEQAYKLATVNSPFYGELVVELINSGKECDKEEVLNIINQNEEHLKDVSDFQFAKGLFYLNYSLACPNKAQNYMRKIEDSLLSCLSLGETEHVEYLQGTSSYLAAYNLAVFYEVSGNINKAINYYQQSSQYGYSLADHRLAILIDNES
jgi:glycosyltransferase involved in cell wall biosynthesis